MARLTALLIAVVAGLTLSATASAHTGTSTVPERIQVPAGNQPFLLAHAIGAQIYACSATAEGPKWQFVAPKAGLYGEHGTFLGTHFAEPTWEATDGSQVKGARVDGVTVDPKAIPWLLLKATPLSPGRLAPTTYIQRLATTGGLEPTSASCQAGTLGKERWVPYTADYVFWKANA